MNFKVVSILLISFLLVGCTSTGDNLTVIIDNENPDLEIENESSLILESQVESNFTDPEEIVYSDPFYNEETGEFTIPEHLEGEDIVLIPPFEKRTPVTYIPVIRDQITYESIPPQREVPISNRADLLPEEEQFIVEHYRDFAIRGGIGNENELDLMLHNTYSLYLSPELWSELIIEGLEKSQLSE